MVTPPRLVYGDKVGLVVKARNFVKKVIVNRTEFFNNYDSLKMSLKHICRGGLTSLVVLLFFSSLDSINAQKSSDSLSRRELVLTYKLEMNGTNKRHLEKTIESSLTDDETSTSLLTLLLHEKSDIYTKESNQNNYTDIIKTIHTLPNSLEVSASLFAKINKGSNPIWRALLSQELGKKLYDAKNYEEAIRCFKYALKQEDSVKNYKLVFANFWLAESLIKNNQRDSLLFYSRNAYRLSKGTNSKDLFAISDTSWRLGVFMQSSGNANDAEPFFRESIDAHLKSYGETLDLVSKYALLADNFYYKWNLKQAQAYAEKAKSVFNNHENEISLYQEGILKSSLCRIYTSLGRYQEAKKNIAPVVQKSLKEFGDASSYTAAMMRDEAYLEWQRGNLHKADSIYKAHVIVAEKSDRLYTKTGAYSQLSWFYISNDMHHKAYPLLKKEERLIAKDNFQDSYIGTYNKIQQLNTYVALDSLDSALEYSEKVNGWINKTYGFSTLTIDAHISLLNARYYRYRKSKAFKDLSESYQYALLVLDLIVKDKSELDLEGSKIFYGDVVSEAVALGIEITYEMYAKSPSPEVMSNALRFFEVNKSSALLDGLRNEELVITFALPSELVDKEYDLKKKLTDLESTLSSSKKISEIQANERLDLINNLDSLKKVYKGNYPEYFSSRSLSKVENISTYKKSLLDSHTAIIEFFIDDDAIFILELFKDFEKFRKLEGEEKILERIRKIPQEIKDQKIEIEGLDEIANKLLPEFQADISKIILITDGALNQLPFEILPYKGDLLISQYAISYAGSVQLLDMQRKLKSRKTSWIGFAPVYQGNALPNNIKEVKGIANLQNGVTVLAEEATKQKFIDQTPGYGIIHLAAHGTLDNYNPANNSFKFSGTIDNELKLSEIYGLNLSSDLAVLSACDTGNGKFEKGDGVMSMSRAFTYAGVSSTLTSLWKVPDRETAIIMKNFYKYLKLGNPKDEALKKAKLDYLNSQEDKILKAPFYWAGFIISGNVEPTYQTNFWWYILLGFGVVIIFFIIKFSSSKKN